MDHGYPLRKLFIETIGLATLNVAFVVLFTYLNTPFLGLNTSQNVTIPLGFIMVTLLLFVFVEELVFRYIPYRVWRRFFSNNKSFWLFGITTSLLFAAMHMGPMSKETLAFPQLLSGLYFWHLIRKQKGFKLVLLSHTMYNLMFITPLIVATRFV
ncbi:CPBP family intramembrane glutamic endopeptidase [Patescibacteria group bacterium]